MKPQLLYVPAAIDDYPLTPIEFRVFARITRRCGGGTSGGCYESIPNMARSLKISEQLVRRALRVLKDCGAVTKEEREGKPDLFTSQPFQKWVPSSELPKIRAKHSSAYLAKARERAATKSGGKNTTTSEFDTTVNNATGVVAKTQGKGISNKVINIAGANAPAPQRQGRDKNKDVHADFDAGMKYLESQIGRPPDYAAQGKALNWMFGEGITLEQIKKYFPRHLREMNGYRTSYLSLRKVIGQWVKQETAKEQPIKSRFDHEAAAATERSRVLAMQRPVREFV